ALQQACLTKQWQLARPLETIRATVIGAGTQTLNISGCTIHIDPAILPLRNVPVVKPFTGDVPVNAEEVSVQIKTQLTAAGLEQGDQVLALAIPGPFDHTYRAVVELGRGIVDGMKGYLAGPHPLVVVLEKDCGRVLGQVLRGMLGREKQVLCIDQINVDDGDYIDIGYPLMDGRVVPVTVKTLVFNN
ncbi:MAG: ethanolamine ammonia-lyase reactivating factor EutA, partial [Desulfofundulus sp.]